ncbi:HlyC/CorC family transporter [Perlucidibaca aquatica]|jgi:magnesium and cobalt transporter|uniref:HlyC/CorC family transporter n=1 Tax=Perlucidibaca aquatica TaxID=1852776 RepID=UPI00083A972A|nr:transporter associated domain-containing protein [Perlucidibaca aquatica]
MNEGDSPKSWLSRLTDVWSDEPETRDDLIAVIRDAAKRGLMDVEALHIIESTLQVSERQVREIMIPRGQMVAIRSDDELREFLPGLIESAHSRFPVLAADNPDEVLGILFAKDLLKLILDGRDRIALKDYLRPAFYVPESTHLDKLIREFRSKKSHMAIVVNEYGGIAGLVTLEDALEQIVGEIDDEHDYEDDEDVLIRETGPKEWVVKALTPIADFNEHFGSRFNNDDFDTIAGIVINGFERLPEKDEQIVLERWKFTILAADSRTIRLLKVEPS